MTDIQIGTNKTSNKDNQKNSIDRPKEHKGNKKTPKKYENFEGRQIE